MTQIYNFTIVGSGTAGWLTALYIQKYYPFTKIRVISSSDIGILGAGEGTTPNVMAALEHLGIPFEGLFKYAKATVKNGIEFTDWNGDGESYFNGFSNHDNFNPFKFNNITGQMLPILALEPIGYGRNINEVFIDSKLNESNRVKYTPNQNINNKLDNARSHLDQMGAHAIHFDAVLLANYLKEIALKREIVHIDDEVVDFVLDENEYIKYIVTKKGEEIKSDFVFDCSGFKRLIIGGLYKSKWISYKEHLPMKKAISFFMDLDDLDEIPPYTESIAMECGWVWKIPIQDRFGCGYVFDSDYITVEEAKEEIIKKFGNDIKWGKEFDFDAGMYETPWVKNCIAIGLSSGFIEPLEATSLMFQVIALNSYLDDNLGAIAKNQFYIDRYNERMRSVNGENMEFIYTHYLTQRSTSKFWTEFRDKNKMPERVKELLDECEVTMPDEMFLTSRRKLLAYGIPSWYSILAGLKLFKPKIAVECIEAILSDMRREEMEIHRSKFKVNMLLNEHTFIKHSVFIEYMLEL